MPPPSVLIILHGDLSSDRDDDANYTRQRNFGRTLIQGLRRLRAAIKVRSGRPATGRVLRIGDHTVDVNIRLRASKAVHIGSGTSNRVTDGR